MSTTSAPTLGRSADVLPEPVQAVDFVVLEIRELMCDRLDAVADKHDLTLADVVRILNDRHGISYASDYEDWVMDAQRSAENETTS